LLVQLAVAAIVIFGVVWELTNQWQQFRETPLVASPRWPFVLLAALVVLATYALLIETWRRILTAWGQQLDFANAARIWFVSNLGKYVPGKIWQVGAMGVMAQQRNVAPAAAAGSAIVSTVVNIATGMAVALIAGWRAIDTLSGGHAALGIALIAGILGSIVLLPTLMPFAVAWLQRITGREIALGAFPHRAIYIAIVGNVISWIAYGIAFQLFVYGVLGSAQGSPSRYIAAYASSYVIGYLAFVVPGGIGVREGALTAMLIALKLTTAPQAAVVAVTSRLWLTVLELLPGVVFLARAPRKPPQSHEAAT
jgi:uncharacterized membrane protein YbhN (UPF0104 family)